MPHDQEDNLAVRVRRPLNRRLGELLLDLRDAGIRTSKAEVIEVLLWKLPSDADEFRADLADFRRHAPREVEA
jgi:hypothetical protein